jgi:Amt family ammonium transporter
MAVDLDSDCAAHDHRIGAVLRRSGSQDSAGATAIHINAGGAAGNTPLAATARMHTFLAASAGVVALLAVERIKDGHHTMLGACSGVIACLVAIQLKHRFRYDDALNVVGVHMVGGVTGGTGLLVDQEHALG